jgi:N6-L-threonylcarbamoyladenine synthase
LASTISSQLAAHAEFGGVVPEIAAREHLSCLDGLVESTLEQAKIKMTEVAAIAVTRGPGLVGSLVVGVAYAKGLAYASSKTLVAVDHVKAHVHGAFLGLAEGEPQFPCLALVVSGGHTNIFYMKNELEFELMAYTLDDACGESFDKVAKLLGLGYPGGPVIERLAKEGDPRSIAMPTPMADKSDLRFSYSGLKTFVVNLLRKEPEWAAERKNDLCASFQEAALGQIARKIKAALNQKPEARSVVISGGVAANGRFRQLMSEMIPLPAYFPPLKYCSDNAAMVAAYGHHLFNAQKAGNISMDPDWDVYSRFQY